MSSTLSQLRNFDKIVQLDLETANFAVGEHVNINKANFTKVAQAAITHLQTTSNPQDDTLLLPFIDKMKLLNKQFAEAGQGTAFATSIHALSLIHTLRSNLDPTRQDIIKDPFILELKALSEAPEIENKSAVAQKLYDFQNNILLPAMQSVQTVQELLALESLVDDCNVLKDKLESVDTKGHLEGLRSTMLSLWNLKSCQTNSLYSFLTSYENGQLKGLDNQRTRKQRAERLDSFITTFVGHIKNPAIVQQDKLAIYNAISIIRKEFEEHGDGKQIDPILKKLSGALDIPEAIHSSFPVELESLVLIDQIPDKRSVAMKLYEFQENILLPALQNASTPETLDDLSTIVDRCAILKDKLASVDSKHALEGLKSTMLALWNAKKVQTNPLFASLINFQKGQIVNLESEEKRTQVASNLNIFVSEFIKISGHSGVSQEDKVSLHKGLCSLHEEFTEHGAGKLIEPILTNLCKALDLPFPKAKPPITARSSDFQALRGKFTQSPSSESLPPSKTVPLRAKKVQTPEEIRDSVFARIQENISRLGVSNPRLREEVQQLKSDIKQLKGLAIMKGGDFSGLEEALSIIVDPNVLNISEEENRFVELLLLKYGASETDLEKYSKLEASSVLNARVSLTQALRKSAGSLETLIQGAVIAKQGLREQVLKERFDRFVEVHPLPALTHNFSVLFPVLISNFEAFTREVAVRELEKKWNHLVQLYDGQSAGKFSKLLACYSYMDPTKQFHSYIELTQDEFFSNLDLTAIDLTTKEQLIPYLVQMVDFVKNYPGELFDRNYMNLYSAEHLWLLDNIQNIRVPFNQGDDHNENLGNGVCYNNSLHRFTLLQANPTLSHQQIKMGSNSKTRYFQSKVKSYYAAAKKKEITFQAADDEQTKVSSEYGLQQFHRFPVVTPPSTDAHEHLLNEMERFALAGHTQFVLSLYSPDGGHAVNIQIDPANGMYRLFDDNIGLCQYKTLSLFKERIAEYFKHFYPTYDAYQFRLFKTI